MIILLLIISIASVLLFFWQVSNLISIFFGSPYVKTDRAIMRRALKLAKIKKGDVFYDLGCGNGDVLQEAAKFDVKVIGFEISPFYFLLSKFRTIYYPNVDVYCRDITKVDLTNADIIYCYLLPKFLKKLGAKFKNELRPGVRVISISFPVKNLKPISRIKYKNHTIYLYKSS